MQKPKFECVHYLNLQNVNEYLEEKYDLNPSFVLDYIWDVLDLHDNGFTVLNLENFEDHLKTCTLLSEKDRVEAFEWLEKFEEEFEWEYEDVVLWVSYD